MSNYLDGPRQTEFHFIQLWSILKHKIFFISSFKKWYCEIKRNFDFFIKVLLVYLQNLNYLHLVLTLNLISGELQLQISITKKKSLTSAGVGFFFNFPRGLHKLLTVLSNFSFSLNRNVIFAPYFIFWQFKGFFFPKPVETALCFVLYL